MMFFAFVDRVWGWFWGIGFVAGPLRYFFGLFDAVFMASFCADVILGFLVQIRLSLIQFEELDALNSPWILEIVCLCW